jgi:hypothetical protein
MGHLEVSETLLGHAYTLEIQRSDEADVAILDTMVSHANIMVKVGKHSEANEVLHSVLQQR